MVKFKNNNNAQSSKKETDKNNEDSGRNINQNITKSKLIGSNSIKRIILKNLILFFKINYFPTMVEK